MQEQDNLFAEDSKYKYIFAFITTSLEDVDLKFKYS